MNTPPGRIARPQTPPTPRHGPKFEEYSPARRSLRLKRENIKSSPTFTNATLSPPPSSPLAQSPSPKQTKKKTRKGLFVLDEGKHVVDVGKGKGKGKGKNKEQNAEERRTTRPTLLNPDEIGLPTPAKTPSRKRKLAPEKVASSAQALFPPTEASSSRSAAKGGLFGTRRPRVTSSLSTPRRKSSTVGTIEVEQGEKSSIEIFTDSDARRPTLDADPDNPFITRPGDETRTSKRLRQKRADMIKNRLGDDAIREDGMVYIFRGKKVFKSFDNIPDREERAASEDQDDESAGLNPTKIKPRLLFPSASPHHSDVGNEQKENYAAEEEVDEEAETDIDEPPQSQSSSIVVSSKKSGKRPVVSRMTPESDDELQNKLTSFKSRLGGVKGRLSGSKALFDEGEDDPFGAPTTKASFSSDEEAIPKPRGVKRSFNTGLGTPSSSRKRTKRVLF